MRFHHHSRALADARDGLKPVHRRILHGMTELRLTRVRLQEIAQIVGDVIGNFHPHGDQAIYDALVRLAQDFSSRYPLVKGRAISAMSTAITRGHALHRKPAHAVAQACSKESTRTRSIFRPAMTARMRSPSSSRGLSRICWPTAPPASPSAWRHQFRRTTPVNCARR
jgi:hypothetical protein